MGCLHSKHVYICAGAAVTKATREAVLEELCTRSPYANMALCALSEELEHYVRCCTGLRHFRALRKLFSKQTAQMEAHFVRDEHGKVWLATPKATESLCQQFISEVLEVSLVRLSTTTSSRTLEEYQVLMAKLNAQTDFLLPHVAISGDTDTDAPTLFLFHRKLADAAHRQRMQREVTRFQGMQLHVVDAAAARVYPWLRRYLHRVLKYELRWDSRSALVTLLEAQRALHLRSTPRLLGRLKVRLCVLLDKVLRVPVHERRPWLEHYELNNNVRLLHAAPGELSLSDEVEGVWYVYHRDVAQTLAWLDGYFEVVLQAGLTLNQFPNDEHILVRDCGFIEAVLGRFAKGRVDGVENDASKLFEYENIVQFVLLMAYQAVLSTRLDLCLGLWGCIRELAVADERNALLHNFVNVVLVHAAKEFDTAELRRFLIDSKVLFENGLLRFVVQRLEENEQEADVKRLREVLEDVHLDDEVAWTLGEAGLTL